MDPHRSTQNKSAETDSESLSRKISVATKKLVRQCPEYCPLHSSWTCLFSLVLTLLFRYSAQRKTPRITFSDELSLSSRLQFCREQTGPLCTETVHSLHGKITSSHRAFLLTLCTVFKTLCTWYTASSARRGRVGRERERESVGGWGVRACYVCANVADYLAVFINRTPLQQTEWMCLHCCVYIVNITCSIDITFP